MRRLPNKNSVINTERDAKLLKLSETGAVFAFGRSHLTISGDGNDNNYFFIKKDRIKKLICGRNQSGVICGNSIFLISSSLLQTFCKYSTVNRVWKKSSQL